MARKNLLKGFKRPKSITFEHLENNANIRLKQVLELQSEILSVVFSFPVFRGMQFLVYALLRMMLMVFLMLFPVNLKRLQMLQKIHWKS